MSDILGLSNAHTSMGAAFALRMFHVKHAIVSVATKYLYFGITEHEHVGLWLCQSPNMTQSVRG